MARDDCKTVDFEIIHEKRQVRQFMDFVLVREDYKLTKPHPEPYLTGLKRLARADVEVVLGGADGGSACSPMSSWRLRRWGR